MDLTIQHNIYIKSLSDTLVKKYCPGDILDLGCGKGEFVSAFRDLGKNAIGIEVDMDEIAQAPPNVLRYLKWGDASKLPFVDQSFDIVFAHHTMEHFADSSKVIQEIKRVLRPNGFVCVVVPVLPFGPEWLWKATKYRNERVHVSMHSVKTWLKLWKSEGFKLFGDIDDILPLDTPSGPLDADQYNVFSAPWILISLYKIDAFRPIWRHMISKIFKSFIFSL